MRWSGDRSYADARSAAGGVDPERTAVEDTEAASQCGLAVAEHVIGKADARSVRQAGRRKEGMIRRLRLNDTRKRRTAQSGGASGSERALPGVRVRDTRNGIDGCLIRGRATGGGGHRDRTIRVQNLTLRARAVSGAHKDTLRLPRSVIRRAQSLKAHAEVGGPPAADPARTTRFACSGCGGSA